MIRYRKKAAALLHAAVPADTGLDEAKIFSLLENPQNNAHGDIAFPCFQLAKALKKAPPLLATELAQALQGKSADFVKIQNLGPYLNFTLSPEAAYVFSQEALARKEKFGHREAPRGQKVLIEYSSPNVAKELHIGHFRNTVLGQALNNIMKENGYETIAVNHLGDWGSQFGIVAYAYKNWGNEKELEANPIAYLTKLYVRFNEEAESNPELVPASRECSKKIEAGDPELSAMREKFVKLSIENLQKIYARLGVKFDHYIGESFYFDKTDALVTNLKKKNLLVESEGAEVVDLEPYKMPPCLIITSAGTTLYATRDIAAAIYRTEKFQPFATYYVVGSEQQLHFRQFFKVIELMGYPWAATLHHVSYGMYRFKDGKFSTRKGRVILLQEVLDEAAEKVKAVINEKNPTLAEKEKIAEIVGIGAVVFNDLSTDRVKDVEFDWEKILDFEGDTGPYIQYSYARCASILRQAETKGMAYKAQSFAAIPACLANSEHALTLLKHCGRLEATIDAACTHQKPSILANYTLDLAKALNGFYRNVRVLDEAAPASDTQAKLGLIVAAKQVLKNSLALLCMEAPEAM